MYCTLQEMLMDAVHELHSTRDVNGYCYMYCTLREMLMDTVHVLHSTRDVNGYCTCTVLYKRC